MYYKRRLLGASLLYGEINEKCQRQIYHKNMPTTPLHVYYSTILLNFHVTFGTQLDLICGNAHH